jgi:hypothetical protein
MKKLPIQNEKAVIKLNSLKTIILAMLVLIITACSSKTEESSDTKKIPDFLLVQNAESIILEDGQLRMVGVSPSTLYFSDRPDRIVGRLSTKNYVDYWGNGENSFKSDPPNAVLSILDTPEPQDIVVVLRKPRLEGEDLVYSVEVLDGNSVAAGGASSLFIDVVGMPLTPVSVAGVRRRTVRRAIY